MLASRTPSNRAVRSHTRVFPSAARSVAPISGLSLSLTEAPLWIVVVLFLLATAVIGVAGVRITRIASALAQATGMGQAIFGAVWLGATTSLPGIVASVTAAHRGHAELAVSNAIGGIAAQTTFLAIADMAYRGVNLEHAAASIENLVQGALLAILLAIPLAAMASPSVTLFGVHPASLLLVLTYAFGLHLAAKARDAPLWRPTKTRETRLDASSSGGAAGKHRRGMARLWIAFVAHALIVAAAGYAVARTGIALANRTGLSETVVGGLFTAIASSLPELVTALAAVRQGALTLAVGDIIGGNSFDVLFLAFSDLGYRAGSIYHAITNRQVFLIAVSLIMTGVLLLGLLRREKTGIANIGFESVLVLLIYAGAVLLMFHM
jgi:cation:H+ antiporter